MRDATDPDERLFQLNPRDGLDDATPVEPIKCLTEHPLSMRCHNSMHRGARVSLVLPRVKRAWHHATRTMLGCSLACLIDRQHAQPILHWAPKHAASETNKGSSDKGHHLEALIAVVEARLSEDVQAKAQPSMMLVAREDLWVVIATHLGSPDILGAWVLEHAAYSSLALKKIHRLHAQLDV